MVDITGVLSLQGRARRNAEASMRRLRRERADAEEAAVAVTRATREMHGGAARAVPAEAQWPAR